MGGDGGGGAPRGLYNHVGVVWLRVCVSLSVLQLQLEMLAGQGLVECATVGDGRGGGLGGWGCCCWVAWLVGW